MWQRWMVKLLGHLKPWQRIGALAIGVGALTWIEGWGGGTATTAAKCVVYGCAGLLAALEFLELFKAKLLVAPGDAVRLVSAIGGIHDGTMQITLTVRATELHEVEIFEVSAWVVAIAINDVRQKVLFPVTLNCGRVARLAPGQSTTIFGVCHLPAGVALACEYPAKVSAFIDDNAYAVFGFPYLSQRARIRSGLLPVVPNTPPTIPISF